MGSTLIEFENHSWDELAQTGQKKGYDWLSENGDSLPDFETFRIRAEEIKDEYRAVARRDLTEWKMNDAFEKLFIEYGFDNATDKADKFVTYFYNVVSDQVELCEGAEDTLRRLKDGGYRTGLISNTVFPGTEHDRDLERFGLLPWLDFTLYSFDVNLRKPNPDIFRIGLEKIGLTAAETLYVGDRYYEDIQGPEQIGMPAVLRYTEGRTYPDPLPENLTVIRQLPELLKLL